jgi:hypothetical protein
MKERRVWYSPAREGYVSIPVIIAERSISEKI